MDQNAPAEAIRAKLLRIHGSAPSDMEGWLAVGHWVLTQIEKAKRLPIVQSKSLPFTFDNEFSYPTTLHHAGCALMERLGDRCTCGAVSDA